MTAREDEARRSIVPAELRENVRMLGAALGTVLREQGGPELYGLVEEIRQAAIAARRDGSDRERGALAGHLAGLESESALQVIRAFATYFHLINIAEETERLHACASGRRAINHLSGSGPLRMPFGASPKTGSTPLSSPDSSASSTCS